MTLVFNRMWFSMFFLFLVFLIGTVRGAVWLHDLKEKYRPFWTQRAHGFMGHVEDAGASVECKTLYNCYNYSAAAIEGILNKLV